MPTLGDLISSRRKAEGWTYDKLAEMSSNALTKQRWQQLGTDTRVNEFPEPKTLELIASILRVGVDRVILATARTLGISVPENGSSLATMLPPSANQLNDEQRDAVLAVVHAMRPTIAATGPGLRVVDDPVPEAARSPKGGGPSVGQQLREERDRVDEAPDPPSPDDEDQAGHDNGGTNA